jgi:membrane protease YdiL (CAAX protease family)
MTVKSSIVQYKSTDLSKPSQVKPRIHLTAAIIGVLPLHSSIIIHHLRSNQPISIQGFIIYLAVVSPLAILIALLLLKTLCGERFQDLNLRPGRLSTDLLAALILCPVIIAANVISNQLLSALIPNSAADPSVRNLFAEIAGNPKLFALFVGVLMPLGVASEEVIRVFMLSRLWKVWPSTAGKLIIVVISACLFGLIHLYQGPIGVVRSAVIGLIMALYYLRFGRVVPLILAHYITNTLQVVVFALAAR